MEAEFEVSLRDHNPSWQRAFCILNDGQLHIFTHDRSALIDVLLIEELSVELTEEDSKQFTLKRGDRSIAFRSVDEPTKANWLIAL